MHRTIQYHCIFPVLAMCLLFATTQNTAARMSNAQKCKIYSTAWADVLAKSDRSLLSASFIDDQTSFIGHGCTDYSGVCPRTDTDVRLANLLTIIAMNNGMASTFLPFKCPH